MQLIQKLCACIAVFLFLLPACSPAPEEATGAKSKGEEGPTATVVRLDPETAARNGVRVERVVRGEFRTARDFPGTVKPNERAVADITPLVRGRVVDVYVDVGQEVTGGALLAILYSSDLGLAQSVYLKARARVYVADQAFRRARFLLDEKVIGQAEMQRRRGDYISAGAELREAHDRLLLLGMQESEIERLDQHPKIQSHVPITAPFNGRIIARDVTRGEVVETTDKLFVVADLSHVWVVANIPEKYIPFVHPARRKGDLMVEVGVSAYPGETFPAKVTYVGDVLDATTRTLQLRLELPNADGRLKPEMFATVRVHSEPEPDVLMVPESAIQRERDHTYLFVQRDSQTYEFRSVAVGGGNGSMVKVLSGVNEGDAVVTSDAFLLKSELRKKDI